MNHFRSHDAPSGASIKFSSQYEDATNLAVQKQLLDGDNPLGDQIESEIQRLVLELRVQWDINKAKGNSMQGLTLLSRAIPGVAVEATYNHLTKTVRVTVNIGYFRDLGAIVDLEDESIGSISFEPSKLAYVPEKGEGKSKKKMAVPPPPPAAPSNAPRLPGGALKA